MLHLGETQATRRATLLGIAAAVWALVIAGRLIFLQVFRFRFYRVKADSQSSAAEELRVPRGSILDREGHVLALSVPVRSVAVNPMRAPEPWLSATLLARILGLDQAKLEARLAAGARARRGFLWVKRKVAYSEAKRLRDLNLEWIDLRDDSLRAYPSRALGAHLLGGVDFLEQGNSGIEQRLDKDLRGMPGQVRLVHDVVGRPIESTTVRPAVSGWDVTLTIDRRLQHVAERELAKAIGDDTTKTGSVVVMDPKTGDILALASFPSFDPNVPAVSKEEYAHRANHAFSVPFEPGSVFKVITVTAALETTRLTPESIINCGNGKINLFGRIIHDHDSYSSLSMADVLAKSSNIGAIQIGLQVGEQNLYNYVRRFGFGQATGLPLPGESTGKVRELRAWGKSSIGSVAMGHEISSTTVQLAQAISVIANSGLLRKPRLILSRQRPGEKPEMMPLEAARPVIRPQTANLVRRMMEGVVLHGTGTKARLDGYRSGGKTGSAQIWDPVGRRYLHLYNASFAGFAPVVVPSVVVVVTINGSPVYGGAVAAPVFREVASAALRLRNVARDLPDSPSPQEESPAELNDLAIPDLDSQPSLLPDLNSSEPARSRDLWGPKVPDFYGKTMPAVLAESGKLGLPVELAGSGIVRGQIPSPGSILPSGSRVLIQFAR